MKILTDYRMMTSQSQKWEESTDNIHYRQNILSRLANREIIPPSVADCLIRLNNKPWWVALRLIWANKSYDIVVTGGFRSGRSYAVLQTLFWWRRKPHLFLDFMLDDPRSDLLWKIKRLYQKEVFKRIDKIVVFSRNEVKTYARHLNIPEDKFAFLPYHTNISQPRFMENKSDYILSAGSSGRDYKTLLEAVRGTGLKLKIITRPGNINGLDTPANVEIAYNISYCKYLELISNCRFVVIPLKSHIRSLGMVVMLEAMSLGKAVLMTRAVSNVEYIRDGGNGFFVDFHNPQQLQEKMLYLQDNPRICNQVGRRAVNDVVSRWTFDKYVHSVLSIARHMVS